MEEEFIPYIEALAMKELGFDIPTQSAYAVRDDLSDYPEPGSFMSKPDEFPEWVNYNDYDSLCSVPLWQQAFRWFRDVKGLFVSYNHGTGSSYFPYIWCVSEESWTNLRNRNSLRSFSGRRNFDSYPEAELACLQQLIKIVQDGQTN